MKIRKKSKSEKGITLVALVVTIIVLLVLAGIAISAILGNDGIINKSKLAKEKYESSQEKEASDIENAVNEISAMTSSNTVKPFKVLKTTGKGDVNNHNCYYWMYIDVRDYSKFTFSFTGTYEYSPMIIAQTDANCTVRNANWNDNSPYTLLKAYTTGTYTVDLSNVDYIEIFEHNYTHTYNHETSNWIFE